MKILYSYNKKEFTKNSNVFIQKILNNFLNDANELLKAFQKKIPLDFLNDTQRKMYNSIKKKIENLGEINDLIKVSEAILLYTRAETMKEAARIYLSSLCCFKHTNENETLTLYMPSLWIINRIHKDILSKKRKVHHSIEEEIINIIQKHDFPIIPEERLKLRIQNFLRRENEKNLFDYAYGSIDAAIC